MEHFRKELQHFLNNRLFMAVLGLTGICGYGFLWTHQTVGIDDTPYLYYFEEGLNAIVGRWVLYLLNKVLGFADFGPFMMDVVGVLLLMSAAFVWTMLFYSVWKDKIPDWGYLFFACFFVANPLHSEVFTYYLHNGVGLGFLLCGVSLCCYREGQLTKKIWYYVGSVFALFGAIGCYESFMIVWITGLLLLLLAERMSGEKCKVFPCGFVGIGIVLGALILRTITIPVVILVFGLGRMRNEAVQRSMGEMVSWVLDADRRMEFVMAVKRAYVMYGAFAYAYLPIFIFVCAVVVMIVVGIIATIRKKDIFVLLLTIGSLCTCFLLMFIEGKVTLYRSAQFLPLICAFGVLEFSLCLHTHQEKMKKAKKTLYVVVIVGLSIFLFRQCLDLNQWFYIDYLKYEDAKQTMYQISYELEKNFDTEKPVVFTGTYQIPKSIISKAYVPYGSKTFYRINRLTKPVDEHLLEKFYRGEYGVWVAQTPSLSVLDWARYAFDTDEEMVRFFEMHGKKIKPLLQKEEYEKAENYSLTLPDFPKKGSIVDKGDYIIVHF